MSAPSIRIGPSGWEYPHWRAVVYPKVRPRGFHPLEFLACHFDTVEINTTFHRMIRPEIARLWLAKIAHNPDFSFTARLHRRFTHERALEPVEVGAFKDGLWPLLRAGRFGCLVLQFPWSFRFTEENREYLIRLRRTFHEFPMAVEMRHNSWLADEALGTLVDYRLGFSNIDQPAYARAMPPTASVTSSTGFVRLHGRNPRYWRQEFEGGGPNGRPNDYLYSPAELDEWKDRIEHVSAHASSTFVITANDASGKSVVNALQLQGLLGLARSHPPAELMRLYPSQLVASGANRPAQGRLFAGPRRGAEPARCAVA
jgi:uncharacterized protein YecE (DUF72 family)